MLPCLDLLRRYPTELRLQESRDPATPSPCLLVKGVRRGWPLSADWFLPFWEDYDPFGSDADDGESA